MDGITISKNKIVILIGLVALAGIMILGSILIEPANGEELLAAPAHSSIGTDAEVASMMDNDMAIGSDDAGIVVIEFSDFQCPFCRKFWIESYPAIKENYIDTGKVQLVYRDFPLSAHPAAQVSAEAVECANEQGKGWQMHDKIYSEQAELGSGTIDYRTDDLKKWANEIGIDISECLDSKRYQGEVQHDLSSGISYGIRGTPAFIVTKRDGSESLTISGARPYSDFQAAFDRLS